MEDCEIGVLTEIGCGAKEGDQKLQSHSVDIGDVEVVRVLYFLRLEKKKNLRAGRNCTW